MAEEQTLAPHAFTHTGNEVLIVKCVAKDGSSYNGFLWPLTVGETVTSPDWNHVAECGGCLHGWPWGFAVGDGKDPDWSGVWLVFGAKPDEVVSLGGKVKAKAGVIRYVGDWQGATNFVLAGQISHIQQRSRGAASATGYSGAAVVTGLCGKAQSGPYGCIALAFYNPSASRSEMRCAEVGCGDGSDGKLKAKTWYCLDETGNFKEIK